MKLLVINQAIKLFKLVQTANKTFLSPTPTLGYTINAMKMRKQINNQTKLNKLIYGIKVKTGRTLKKLVFTFCLVLSNWAKLSETSPSTIGGLNL